jgi:hypothetical protein
MKMKLIRPFYILMLLVATSCIDDVTSLNKNPKAYQSGTVPAGPFFSNATRNLVDAITYGFTFKILAQQFAETTYFDASSYNLVNVGNGFWVSMYRDVLLDYQEAKKVVADKPSLFPATDKNQLAIIEIMEVYTYSLLVNTYGNIPYSGAVNTSLKSEALDSDNLTPAYDDAAAIYDDLFVRLDKAIASLDNTASGFGDADLVYGSLFSDHADEQIDAWIRFANSLKLRMALTLADVNPSKAKSAAESAFTAGVIASNDDNALLVYKAVTPNTNPIWVNLIQSEREDFVASNTMMDLMKAPVVDDPRIPLYYTEDNAGGYSGGIYGRSNSYVTYSKAGETMTAKEFPGVLLDYAEVEFLLAEGAARGFNVGAAATHYNNGIIASVEYWGGDTAAANAYIADPTVAYATASGTAIQKIARQKYLALFNRGLEAWTEYRRFDFPTFNKPPVANGDFPIRYTYPNSEQTSNGSNYTAAASAIGGDVVTNRVFWDTK